MAIISIILIVALVLFFTSRLTGITQLGIGDSYGPQPGIVPLTKLPPRVPFGAEPQFPAGPSETIGTTTPFMIFFRGEYGDIREMSKCWNDISFIMAAPQDAFSCYSVPTSGPAVEVTGWFWPTSSAMPRPLYQIGGDIYCYEHFPYERSELYAKLKEILLPKGWGLAEINGQKVLVCQKGQYFIYPQGYPQY
ncbi:MAG: hypothetical protein QW165_02020 [Candidatus Woesearchaeota archaeon]